MDANRLLLLAERLAERELVDWDAEIHSTSEREERAVVSSMRLLARISAMHKPAALRPLAKHDPVVHPQRWGRLEKLTSIGQGGFGRVYKAWDPVLEIWVALKLARPDANGHVQNMLDEARLLARMRHDTIVRIYGAEKHDGNIGIWMEFVDGRTLDEIVKSEGPLSEAEATVVGQKLAEALSAVHRAGVVHKDIKAHNVMREQGGRIVLMDFGAGSRLDEADGEGSLRGTPYYLAPEVLEGQPPSARSDIYSLGVLLFYLVTGRYPVGGKSLAEIEAKHRQGRVTWLVDVRPELGRNYCGVVQKALNPDPQGRFVSAGRLAHVLQGREQRFPAWAKLAVAAAPPALAAIWYLAIGASSYSIETSFYRVGRTDQQLLSGATVAPSDKLYLRLRADKPLHFYVINQDTQGQAALLFPLPGLQPTNPLRANETHHLPGSSDGEDIYWVVTSAGERERFLMVASRKPLAQLEALLQRLQPAQFDQPIQYPPLQSIQLDSLSGVLGLAPASPSKAGPAEDELFQNIEALTAQPEKQRGVWVRRLDLQNP